MYRKRNKKENTTLQKTNTKDGSNKAKKRPMKQINRSKICPC